MTLDAEIDLLFLFSGYTLETETSDVVPCDFMQQDTEQEGEEGFGGMVLNRRTALVRASAFTDLVVGSAVTVTDEDSNATRYTVASPPRKIQDGLVLQLMLQVEGNA